LAQGHGRSIVSAERRRILFVAPNSFVLRNWIASGLADRCADTLGLEPVFVSHFSDASFTSPDGKVFSNRQIPLVRIRGKELPQGYPYALYLQYYVRLRMVAQEMPNGGGQLLGFSRKRDAWHYALTLVRRLFPSGSGVRRRLREFFESQHIDIAVHRDFIKEIAPACLVIGTPAIMFLDQLMLLAARHQAIPVHCVVNSWDNLVSRGPMMRRPDSLSVWNECMRDHALRVHGLDPSRIHVVGALQFSQYARTVTEEERRAVRHRLGLADETPYLLYLGSAEIPKYEEEDVRVLLEQLDRSELAGMPLVVRAHPQADATAFAGIRHPRLHIDRAPRLHSKGGNGLSFDDEQIRAMAALLSDADLVFSSAGTTALLEAAIFDRPVVQLRWLDAIPRARSEELERVRDYQCYLHIQDLDATGCRVFSERPDALVDDVRNMLARASEFREKRRLAVEHLVTTPLDEAPDRVIRVLARYLGIAVDAKVPSRISA
jgi:hypothetical protein